MFFKDMNNKHSYIYGGTLTIFSDNRIPPGDVFSTVFDVFSFLVLVLHMHFVDRAFYKFCNFIEILKIEATSTATFIYKYRVNIYILFRQI